MKSKKSEGRTLYLCEGVSGVEEGEFVPLETLDMLDHEGEVSHRLQAQLRLQRVQHVLGDNIR